MNAHRGPDTDTTSLTGAQVGDIRNPHPIQDAVVKDPLDSVRDVVSIHAGDGGDRLEHAWADALQPLSPHRCRHRFAIYRIPGIDQISGDAGCPVNLIGFHERIPNTSIDLFAHQVLRPRSLLLSHGPGVVARGGDL